MKRYDDGRRVLKCYKLLKQRTQNPVMHRATFEEVKMFKTLKEALKAYNARPDKDICTVWVEKHFLADIGKREKYLAYRTAPLIGINGIIFTYQCKRYDVSVTTLTKNLQTYKLFDGYQYGRTKIEKLLN